MKVLRSDSGTPHIQRLFSRVYVCVCEFTKNCAQNVIFLIYLTTRKLSGVLCFVEKTRRRFILGNGTLWRCGSPLEVVLRAAHHASGMSLIFGK